MGAEINVKNLFAVFDSLSGLKVKNIKTLLEDFEMKKAAVELDVDSATLGFGPDDAFVMNFVRSVIDNAKFRGSFEIKPYFLRNNINILDMKGEEISDFHDLKMEYDALLDMTGSKPESDGGSDEPSRFNNRCLDLILERYKQFFKANERVFSFINGLGNPKDLMELLVVDEKNHVNSEIMKDYWAHRLKKHYGLELDANEISKNIEFGNSTSLHYLKIKGSVVPKIILSPECQDFSIGVGSAYLGDGAKCLLNGTNQNGATILFSYDRDKIKRGQYPLCDSANAFASLKRLLPYLDINPLLVELLSSDRSL